MEHDQFVGQVQDRARLASRGDAERSIRATFETLGERLSGGAASNLAAQLPSELAENLRRTVASESASGEQFSLDEFFQRVTRREGVDQPDAVFHARAVVEVVDDATTGNLVSKIREQLPAEYDRLFEAGSTGRMAPAR